MYLAMTDHRLLNLIVFYQFDILLSPFYTQFYLFTFTSFYNGVIFISMICFMFLSISISQHMRAGRVCKTIVIDIEIYDKSLLKEKKAMSDNKNVKKFKDNGKFCTICFNQKVLNEKDEPKKKRRRTCPVCLKYYEKYTLVDKETINNDLPIENSDAKVAPDSESNIANGLTLLNEVLTVFQNKKADFTKESSKTILVRDTATNTESWDNLHRLSLRLSMSKIFLFSIEDTNKNTGNKFVIMNSSQPNSIKNSTNYDLLHRKSSSIPQMKIDELKNSMKQKASSKDAIQEVNRLFATFRKRDSDSVDESNCTRPTIRSGPRVLPVVQKKTDATTHKFCSTEVGAGGSFTCKCCQTNSHCLSGGDSDSCYNRCEKCIYMLCCRYRNRDFDLGLCDRCRGQKNCKHDLIDDSVEDCF